MLSVEAAGNNEPLSRAPGLQARRGAQDFRRWLRKVYSPNECLWYGNVCLFFAGRKSEKELPALAAQPRAFSSLLSLPSQAQSVIKAFRRQGIGSADEFNTARFFLSRLESLSALLQVFQIFRGRASLACFLPCCQQPLPRPLTTRRSQDRRECVLCSAPLSLHSTNPTDSP